MFKKDFKYYKSKTDPPDLSKVLDFNCDNKIPPQAKLINVESSVAIPEEFLLTLIHPREWRVFELKPNHPGLIFIKNPFTSLGQRYWISRCLKDYTKKPNKLNIDVHNYLSEGEDWWNYCRQKIEDVKFAEKLRWATLGYHHNWNTKVYVDQEKADFPRDLATLSSYIATCLNLGPFKAEAAIVNFYHMDSTLSGHTDHSERNLDAPLFSFSFGQSAIFIVGGLSIEDKSSALFLHSGDLVIMTKKSRLAYHGVPRIVPAPTNNPWMQLEHFDDSKYCNDYLDTETLHISASHDLWNPFEDYVNKSRININVRQVNINV